MVTVAVVVGGVLFPFSGHCYGFVSDSGRIGPASDRWHAIAPTDSPKGDRETVSRRNVSIVVRGPVEQKGCERLKNGLLPGRQVDRIA